MQALIVDGINIQIAKKAIKNLYVRVYPLDGRVLLTAPRQVSDRVLQVFINSKLTWIKKQRQKFAEQTVQTRPRYLDGETCHVWGRQYILEAAESSAHGPWGLVGDRLVLPLHPQNSFEQRKRLLVEWYREQLKLAVPPILDRCENIVGVRVMEWHVKNMRTRWGTCNPARKRIWLSLQLAQKSPECLEYVIIHELVHLLERKHTEKFREYMDSFCPSWRSVKKDLNRA